MKRSIRRLVSALALGVLTLVSVASLSTASSAEIAIGIGISVRIGPPALPVYAQPICPGPGYLWTPGYWAWNDVGGYYWVPGTWVIAPVGMLWTPGYWGFAGGLYGWHAGYWGPHVGFYGGINYGFGYGGVGFAGGEWRGGAFFYNRAVMNVNVTNVRNVYNRAVVVNNTHVAFNGAGGVEARPSAQEEAYAHESHTPALAGQTEHERSASQNRQLFASENHGRPAVAATARPGDFSGRNVSRASAAGAEYHAPKMSPQEARASNGNRGSGSNEASYRNEASRNDNRSNDRSNDRSGTSSENHGSSVTRTAARTNEAGNRGMNSPHDNPKPSKQVKQAQKQAQKQAKAEAKRNAKEEHR